MVATMLHSHIYKRFIVENQVIGTNSMVYLIHHPSTNAARPSRIARRPRAHIC